MQKFSQLILVGLGIGLGYVVKQITVANSPTLPEVTEVQPSIHESPVPDPSKVMSTYGKLPSVVRKTIAGMIRAKEKVNDQTVTPATGWLYACICERIDRKRNRLEASLAEMEEATGMNADTIIRHTQILESMGLLEVDRRRDNPTRNDVNVYHIAGAGKHVVLWIGTNSGAGSIRVPLSDNPSQSGGASESLLNDSFKHHVGSESTTPSIKESSSHGLSENAHSDQFPLPAVCERIGMDSLVATRLIAKHGLARVTATCTEAAKRHGLNNPAGWAVNRIVDANYTPAPIGNNAPPSFTNEDENFDAWLKQRAERDAAQAAKEQQIAPLKAMQLGEKSAWDVWEIARQQLELQGVTMRGIDLVNVCDGVFQLKSNNPRAFVLSRNFKRVLSDVAGQAIDVAFVEMAEAG